MVESMPNATWQQTMLRVKDPIKSLVFYQNVMGMTLIDKLDFPSMKFSLYFLTTLPTAEKYPYTPGTDQAHTYLWNIKGVTLELTHNYGSETDGTKYHIGNQKGDGFGHIAFACDDVYKSCEIMEEKKVPFHKKPNGGRMKGIAFALDPDGYWVEIVSRVSDSCSHLPEFSLAQTMLRVKDPVKSLAFYTKLCGMTLLRELHFEKHKFSLYFLATVNGGDVPDDYDPKGDGAKDFIRSYYGKGPVLELTHNHGTEKQDDFVHFNGNEKDRKGFGHIGFLVDDVDKACAVLEANGTTFKKKPNAGKMKGLAFALDPDGYWIEIIYRGMKMIKGSDGSFNCVPPSITTDDTDTQVLDFSPAQKDEVITYQSSTEKHPKAKIIASKKAFIRAMKKWEAKNIKKKKSKNQDSQKKMHPNSLPPTGKKKIPDIEKSTSIMTSTVSSSMPTTTATTIIAPSASTAVVENTTTNIITATTTTTASVNLTSKTTSQVKKKHSFAAKDILVCSRVRPLSKDELKSGNFNVVSMKKRQCFIHQPLFHTFTGKIKPDVRKFNVDRAFGHKEDSRMVYDMIGAPIIPIAIQGGTGILFAYGQTGSGKTFTMSAILNFLSNDLFQQLTADSYKCSVTVVELRGDSSSNTFNCTSPMITTCLQSQKKVEIKENRFSEVVIEGAVEKEVTNHQEFQELITYIISKRQTCATIKNPSSSRSHLVIKIRIKALNIEFRKSNITDGFLYIVDLAGSETAADRFSWLDGSSNDEERLQESKHINVSLNCLKQCITARGDVGRGKHIHIPYRSSKLTLLLKHGFELAVKRPVKLGVVACISPLATDATHSINTMKYTSKLKAGPPIQIVTISFDPTGWNHEEASEWLVKHNLDPNDMIPGNTDSGRTLAALSETEFITRAMKKGTISREQAKELCVTLWSDVVDARKKYEGQKEVINRGAVNEESMDFMAEFLADPEIAADLKSVGGTTSLIMKESNAVRFLMKTKKITPEEAKKEWIMHRTNIYGKTEKMDGPTHKGSDILLDIIRDVNCVDKLGYWELTDAFLAIPIQFRMAYPCINPQIRKAWFRKHAGTLGKMDKWLEAYIDPPSTTTITNNTTANTITNTTTTTTTTTTSSKIDDTGGKCNAAKGMETRFAGSSGLEMSILGFGCWQFGSKGKDDYWGLEYTQDMANKMVQVASTAGMTYFDTAADYAGGDSEIQLGLALKNIDPLIRNKIVIGSKITPNNCVNVKKHLNETLERLQIETIDLYMVHWPIDKNSMSHFASHNTTESGGRDYSATGHVENVPPTTLAFQTLMKLQKEGKIKHIGVSNFGVAQLKEVLALGVNLAVNQLCYNLIFRAIEFEILPFCQQHGIGVVCYSPLMQGLLTGRWKNIDDVPTYRARTRHFNGKRPKSRHGEEGHEDLLFKTLSQIEEISKRSGLSMLQLALAWPLRNSIVASVIAGITKEHYIPLNCEAIATKIPDDVLKELNIATEALKQAMGGNADLWQGGDDSRVN